MVKKKVCVIAFDDAPHKKEDLIHVKKAILKNRDVTNNMTQVDLIGVVFRGHQLLNVIQSHIDVDGLDSTQRIIEVVTKNPFFNELRLILIDSPTLGGFNVVNPFEINSKTGLPVVLLPDDKPGEKIINVYKKVFPERKEQIEWLENLPELQKLEVNINRNPTIYKEIYFHLIGVTREEIHELMEYLCEFSSRPEPLRVAHLIASRERQH